MMDFQIRRLARRAILLLLALTTVLGWGCGVRDPSPREPFAAPAAQPTEAPPAFHVLEQWHWPDTLPAHLPPAASAAPAGRLGLYPADRFQLTDGRCDTCRTPAAALWYFRDEIVAVPRADMPIIGLDPPVDELPHPAVLWIGAPDVLESARLSADGRTLTAGGRTVPLALTPQIPTNLSYPDHTTARFFSQRDSRARGAHSAADPETFVARTLWPEDARIDSQALTLEPLVENEKLSTLIEAQASGSDAAFPARLLFERQPGEPRQWYDKPVLAMVLSGAQGDDDGSLAGHLGIATGFFGSRGEWQDWIVDNFYPLRDVSSKGIIPASVPMDNYLLDFNSGQLYYRPGYMLVAVLRRPDVASDIHQALHQTMLAFYCRDFTFDQASFNSTAMTMDPIRALGWRIPYTGPTSRLLALLAAPIAAVVQLSPQSGRTAFDAFRQETSRLLPRVAFEVAGHDLLHLVSSRPDPAELTEFEQRLMEDVEAVLFVRLPQVPSERRVGTFPPRSLFTYGAKVFVDPTEFETAPETGERHLPRALEDACTIRAPTPRD